MWSSLMPKPSELAELSMVTMGPGHGHGRPQPVWRIHQPPYPVSRVPSWAAVEELRLEAEHWSKLEREHPVSVQIAMRSGQATHRYLMALYDWHRA